LPGESYFRGARRGWAGLHVHTSSDSSSANGRRDYQMGHGGVRLVKKRDTYHMSALQLIADEAVPAVGELHLIR